MSLIFGYNYKFLGQFLKIECLRKLEIDDNPERWVAWYTSVVQKQMFCIWSKAYCTLSITLSHKSRYVMPDMKKIITGKSFIPSILGLLNSKTNSKLWPNSMLTFYSIYYNVIEYYQSNFSIWKHSFNLSLTINNDSSLCAMLCNMMFVYVHVYKCLQHYNNYLFTNFVIGYCDHFLCLSVCVYVCYFVCRNDNRRTNHSILMKFVQIIYYHDRKVKLDDGLYP